MRKCNILEGQKFGRLTVLGKNGKKDKWNAYLWTCRCECGKYKDVTSSRLTSGFVKSCGCLKYERRKNSGRLILDIIGRKYGKLTVLCKTKERSKDNRILWLCKCECGNLRKFVSRSLRNHYIRKSCGCLGNGSDFVRRPMGYKKKNFHGYVYIKCECHPNSSKKDGRVLEHVYVMTKYLERPLRKNEQVHHRNGIKDDNRLENLELWSKGHPSGQRVSDMIDFCYDYLKINASHLIK